MPGAKLTLKRGPCSSSKVRQRLERVVDGWELMKQKIFRDQRNKETFGDELYEWMSGTPPDAGLLNT